MNQKTTAEKRSVIVTVVVWVIGIVALFLIFLSKDALIKAADAFTKRQAEDSKAIEPVNSGK
ncbi:MAG: hypothetical protein LKM30_04175 [Bacilli bacterium]|jgi:hypothetical protein|nr:hypothetical protein [Bacilli bacterium]